METDLYQGLVGAREWSQSMVATRRASLAPWEHAAGGDHLPPASKARLEWPVGLELFHVGPNQALILLIKVRSSLGAVALCHAKGTIGQKC